jgi:hypothetical protein
MHHYYVLSSHPQFLAVFTFIRVHGLEFSAHLNRTRFWVPEGEIFTEFALRFAEHCKAVDPTLDLATGLHND